MRMRKTSKLTGGRRALLDAIAERGLLRAEQLRQHEITVRGGGRGGATASFPTIKPPKGTVGIAHGSARAAGNTSRAHGREAAGRSGSGGPDWIGPAGDSQRHSIWPRCGMFLSQCSWSCSDAPLLRGI